MPLSGIDISKHQGVIDFDAAQASGLAEFIWPKATEGVGYTDPRFFYNWTEGGRVGAVRGAYHFARPDLQPNNPDDAKNEAEWFLSRVKLEHRGDFLVLDYEPKTVAPGFDDRAIAVPWCRQFLDEVYLRVGVKAFLYLNLSQAGRNAPYDWSPIIAAGHPLILAFYRPNDGHTASQVPPTQWPEVAMHQWTSRGTVAGISGPVDRCLFFGTREQLMAHGIGGGDMLTEEKVKEIWRAMADSPEGSLKVRQAVYRSDAENLANHPPEHHDVLKGQLAETEAALRQWTTAKGQWVLVKGEPHAGQTLEYAGMDANGTVYFYRDERGEILTLIRK